MLFLSEKIRFIRIKAGLSKSQLAQAMGVKPPTVTNWESGKIKMLSANNLHKICKLFDVEEEWLLEQKKKSPKLKLEKNLSHQEMLNLLNQEDLDALGHVMRAMLFKAQYKK